MADDERYFGFLVSDVSRLLRTEFDRRVRQIGLTRSQWMMLSRLYRTPGASQSELAEALEVEKATAGRLIDRLETKGWVERRPDAADRRVKRIHLTREAERVQQNMLRIARSTVEDALAPLNETERDTLVDLMIRVKAQAQTLLQDGMAGHIPDAQTDAQTDAEAQAVEAAIR